MAGTNQMKFRQWCGEMWFHHVDEIIEITGQSPKYLSQEYFGMYKYWLKREFKHQRGKENV
jgi:acyl-homoserine lactone acylase PvdQ